MNSKRYKNITFYTLIIYILFQFNSFSQNDTISKIQYSPSYVFKDGVFISFEQLLLNKPLSFDRITNGNKNDINWYDNLFKSQKINFLDDNGIQQSINTKQIWGYCRNNALYINYNNDFYRIPYIGKLSHFVGTQIIRNDFGYDPYSGYYPGMMPTYETNRVVQNLIDFENGKIYPFTLETVQAFISKDSELFNEFDLLKKNKKKEMMFLYIRRYNERNPLYLPKY